MKYNVRLYYSGYLVVNNVEARDESSAIFKARKKIDKLYDQNSYIAVYGPVIPTLEPWPEGDEASEA